jgi:hypothetical protein
VWSLRSTHLKFNNVSCSLNNSNNKHNYAGQLNSLTYLRALLVLHDRGFLGLVSQLASLMGLLFVSLFNVYFLQVLIR